jgi:hypothetical protein
MDTVDIANLTHPRAPVTLCSILGDLDVRRDDSLALQSTFLGEPTETGRNGRPAACERSHREKLTAKTYGIPHAAAAARSR